MKKALLFISVFFLVTNIFAQIPTAHHYSKRLGSSNNIGASENTLTHDHAHKTTGPGGSRWYSFYDYLTLSNPFRYTGEVVEWSWFSNKAITWDQYLQIYDTMQSNSCAFIFDPTFNSNYGGFNDSNFYSGMIAISPNDPYTIDSITIYGSYFRTAINPTAVDTLRIAMMYGKDTGSNISINYLTGMTPFYDVDTIKYASFIYDSVNVICGSTLTSNPVPLVKDIYLTAADTSPINIKAFKTSISNFNVPANQLTALTITFKNGQNVPLWDTIVVDTAGSELFLYNTFSGAFCQEYPDSFPAYYQGYYNAGYLNPSCNISIFDDTGNLRNYYAPLYDFLQPTVALYADFPIVDLHVTCGNCNLTNRPGGAGVKNIEVAQNNASLFPNPASDNISIRIKSQFSKGAICVTDMLGREIYKSELTGINQSIDVSQWVNGMYICNVIAEGKVSIQKFVVNH